MADAFPYLVAIGRLGDFLRSLRDAQSPDVFNLKFLRDLGYTSSNDRLFIGLLKALGFIDANGKPSARYFDYLDPTQSAGVLAKGVEEAFEPLFRVNKKAYKMTREELKGKLKSLTHGQISDVVIDNIAKTFLALIKHADFAPPRKEAAGTTAPPPNSSTEAEVNEQESPVTLQEQGSPPAGHQHRMIDTLGYRIEINLPTTRDKAVYDAIFRSVKEHLL